MTTADPGTQPAGDAADREARISELAAGFALGELSDVELRELYEALREPGERGLVAARLTWQQLGVVTDLRAGMGDLFQSEVKFRIERTGRSDRFVRDSRNRLGAGRPGLDAVEAPRTSPRLNAWPVYAALLAAIAVAVAGGLWWTLSHDALCRVAAVSGEATLGGEPLVVGMGIDHRQVVVPDGSQVSLSWSQRAEVEVLGPANVVAQSQGLSLANGAIWVRAGRGFTVGLPDDTATVQAGTSCAIAAQEGQSVFGVSSGRVGLSQGGRSLEASQAGTAQTSFPWMFYDLQSLPTATLAVPSWRLEAKVSWRDAGRRIPFTVTTSGSGVGWRLAWSPGSLSISDLPAVAPTSVIQLPGAPLRESQLTLIADHGRLAVLCDGASLLDEPQPGPLSVALGVEDRAELAQLSFHSGPLSAPPVSGN